MPKITYLHRITQGNCYKVYIYGMLFCIVHDEMAVETICTLHANAGGRLEEEDCYSAELAYIPNIGF